MTATRKAAKRVTVVLTPGERRIICRALFLGLHIGWLITETERSNATSAESAARNARVSGGKKKVK